jgi:hypothetical protein
MISTVTLNLPENENAVLEELAAAKGMSKTAVLRQALRLYQLVDRNGASIQVDGQRKLLVVL